MGNFIIWNYAMTFIGTLEHLGTLEHHNGRAFGRIFYGECEWRRMLLGDKAMHGTIEIIILLLAVI